MVYSTYLGGPDTAVILEMDFSVHVFPFAFPAPFKQNLYVLIILIHEYQPIIFMMSKSADTGGRLFKSQPHHLQAV